MKIAFLVPGLHGGGAEFVARQWAETLGLGGSHEITVITTHSTDSNDDSAHDEYRLVRLPNRGSFLRRVLDLRSLVKNESFDILMGLMPHWNVLALLSTRGLGGRRPKVIISGHSIEEPLKKTHRVELSLARLLYPATDGYVAASHAVAAEAIARYGFSPSKVWVIPNPALGKTPLDKALLARAARAEGAFSSHVHLVVPARLAPIKRPELALEVAAELNRISGDDTQTTVHFYGSGDTEDQVAERAQHLGVKAVFHGWVEGWFRELPDHAVTLLTSRTEGFGNVLVESAAFGVPAVASSRALGVADAIVPGITGSLASSDTAADLAQSVLAARRVIVPADLQDWLERFTPQHSAQKLDAVFLTLADSSVPEQSEGRRP